MKRTTCSSCGYDDLKLFLDLGLSPIADAYTDTVEQTAETYPLQLAVCTGCRLVQLLEVVDKDILFGTGYSFYSSASPPLSRYHHAYAKDVVNNIKNVTSPFVVEIGCNDGDMLRHFRNAGIRSLGVDPSGGPVKMARESRYLDVLNVAFDESIGHQIKEERGLVDVAIANHVLAHVEDVSSVLAGIAAMLAPDGVAMIEVQYLPDLLVNNAFDLVYHEHRNFFSLSSLEKAAQRHGLYAVDVELTDRQGGSLRATLSKTRRPNPAVDRVRASESWLSKFNAYDGFQGRADRIRDRLRHLVLSRVEEGKRVAGYGAPAKATTLLNFCGLDRNSISHVVDSTKAKQGRFVPGTGIPIVAPNTSNGHVDAYLLLAHNYARTILGNNWQFSAYSNGEWILPIPAPFVI